MTNSAALKLQELSVFAELDKDPVIHAFFELVKLSMSSQTEPVVRVRRAYAHFVGLLYARHTQDWTGYISDRVLSLDTCCTYFAAQDHEVPRLMLDAAMNELAALSQAAEMQPEDFFEDAHMAKWASHAVDLQAEFLNRLIHISQYGYGKFARYRMFRLTDTHYGYEIEPVSHPDGVTFSDLFGYEEQHQAVINNTRLLLEGRHASNILLYGDAGTGKSATVKATCNLLYKDGLRLIEVSKHQLRFLPSLLDELSDNPLKFIIFIDDLSFQENDDDFAALKAVLEGSVSARSENTVIYATSNRRHIVRETFSAREGDDIHRNDTVQETISLSERFGIRILFGKPSSDQYYDIVSGLADSYGLEMQEDVLKRKSEAFALRTAGRSARAARQFVEQMVSLQENEKFER